MMPKRNALKLFMMGFTYSEMIQLVEVTITQVSNQFESKDVKEHSTYKNVVSKLHELKNYTEWHFPETFFLDYHKYHLFALSIRTNDDYLKFLIELKKELISNLREFDIDWNTRKY